MHSRLRQFAMTEVWPPPLRRVPFFARAGLWFGIGSALGGVGLVLRGEARGSWLDDGLLLLTISWPVCAAMLLLLDFGVRRVLTRCAPGRRVVAKTSNYELRKAGRLLVGSGNGLLIVGVLFGHVVRYNSPEAILALVFGALFLAGGALLIWRYRDRPRL